MPEFISANQGRPLLGVLLVVLATLAFALSDVVTKYLTVLYPVMLVIAVRYLVNVLLLVAIFWPTGRAALWRTNRTGLVIVRGLCLGVGSLTMAYALSLMPVGEAVAIIYVSPFAVMILAGRFLGEKVSAVGWIGAAVGFLGVLLIVRPGGGLDPLGVTLALINAALGTGYHLLTRLLGRTETTMAMLFHSAWVGAVLFGLLAIPLSIGSPMPPVMDMAFMVLLGATMAVGHFLFTRAYREAPASTLAPVNYLHVVWAGTLGWLVFDHIPDALAIIGMVLVTGAGVAIALRTHQVSRQSVAAAKGRQAPPDKAAD